MTNGKTNNNNNLLLKWVLGISATILTAAFVSGAISINLIRVDVATVKNDVAHLTSQTSIDWEQQRQFNKEISDRLRAVEVKVK